MHTLVNASSVAHPTSLMLHAGQVRGMLGGRTLFGLVNNAGVGFHGPLLYQPIAEFQRNVEINLVGTLIATQARTCTAMPASWLMREGHRRWGLLLLGKPK